MGATENIIKFVKPIIDSGIHEKLKEETIQQYSGGLTQFGIMNRGLTSEEEKYILPRLIGVSPTSPNWQDKVEEYWADFMRKVPYAGIKINCGYKMDGEQFVPTVTEDFIFGRLLENDSNACTDSSTLNESIHTWLVIDETKRLEDEASLVDIKVEADKAFVELTTKENAEELMQFILLANYRKLDLLTMDIFEFSKSELTNRIYKFKEIEPKLFTSEVKSKNIDKKALMRLSESLGIVERNTVTNEYIYISQDKRLGDGKTFLQTLISDSKLLTDLQADVKSAMKVR